MAKTSMVEREKRRAGIVKKYAAKRAKWVEFGKWVAAQQPSDGAADALERLEGPIWSPPRV